MNCNDIRVVSVFSGCGGSDLGMVGDFVFNGHHYEPLPYRITQSIDNDPKALKTLGENIKSDSIVCDDIRNIPTDLIDDHDVLIGGFPCQSFSTVNPTKNPDDDRAQLYLQMVRILKEKQPKAFIAENVNGMFTLRKGEIFRKIREDFEQCGYKVHAQLMNAADYGIPQRRVRLIMVGIRKDLDVDFAFPEKTTEDEWVPLSSVIDDLDIANERYYFSERAVMGMRNAKNNMKRGLAQDLDCPSLTVTSHLAKVSLNSRDPVLMTSDGRYRRFTPREAARIQSFPDSFEFVGSEQDAYRQIGNAIPPVLFWHVANRLKGILQGETPDKTIR